MSFFDIRAIVLRKKLFDFAEDAIIEFHPEKIFLLDDNAPISLTPTKFNQCMNSIASSYCSKDVKIIAGNHDLSSYIAGKKVPYDIGLDSNDSVWHFSLASKSMALLGESPQISDLESLTTVTIQSREGIAKFPKGPDIEYDGFNLTYEGGLFMMSDKVDATIIKGPFKHLNYLKQSPVGKSLIHPGDVISKDDNNIHVSYVIPRWL